MAPKKAAEQTPSQRVAAVLAELASAQTPAAKAQSLEALLPLVSDVNCTSALLESSSEWMGACTAILEPVAALPAGEMDDENVEPVGVVAQLLSGVANVAPADSRLESAPLVDVLVQVLDSSEAETPGDAWMKLAEYACVAIGALASTPVGGARLRARRVVQLVVSLAAESSFKVCAH